VFEPLWVARHRRWRFLRSVGHGVTLLRRKATPEGAPGQLPKIGAADIAVSDFAWGLREKGARGAPFEDR